MRKRSIFLALGTALALVVLTAGLAFASGRWDGHHGSGYATGRQVSTSIQPKAQQSSGAVQSTGSRTGRDWCDQSGARARMAARTAIGYPTCVARTSDHRSSGVHSVQATTRATATTSVRSSCQPRYGTTNQRYGSGSQWSYHDGCCRHDWR